MSWQGLQGLVYSRGTKESAIIFVTLGLMVYLKSFQQTVKKKKIDYVRTTFILPSNLITFFFS